LLREMQLPSKNGYQIMHQELFSASVEYLLAAVEPNLRMALQTSEAVQRDGALRRLCSEITPGVYAIRLFPDQAEPAAASEDIEKKHELPLHLLSELESIERWALQSGWNLARPNSMNRYGVVLQDIGLSSLLKVLVDAVVIPLAKVLWQERQIKEFDDVHGFTVRYRGDEDRRLDTHVDNSEVTLNICLGGDFVGGGVYFHRLASEGSDEMVSPHPAECPHCCVTHPHQRGLALLHLGNHIHGAHNIDKGQRTNLVIWCRRS